MRVADPNGAIAYPSVSLPDFLSAPAGPGPEEYYSLLRGDDQMPVHRQAVNLILGRDIRRNVSYSAVMATELAQKGDRVLYLNTYAGEQFLRQAFQVPPVGGLQKTEDGPASGPASSTTCPKQGERIQIASIPTGEWNIKKVLPLVEGRDVVIVNSFEFAALTRALKDRIAADLVGLKEKTNVTLVVFASSLQRDVAAGVLGRGPVGVLAGAAAAVSHVGDEHIAARTAAQPAAPTGPTAPIAPEYAVKGKVNEKRMLNAYLLPKKFGGHRPDPTVDIRPDTGFSYHYADFWCNPFDRGPTADYTGRAMSLLARTPLLQKYLLDHPDTTFMQGNTPSEARLAAEMTLG